MRNLVFAAALGVAVVGGVAIGSVVDLPSAGPSTSDREPAWRSAEQPQRPLPVPIDPRPWGGFTVDTTQSERSESGPIRPAYGEAPPAGTCRMPGAGTATVVLFGVYEGDAVSTVALDSQDHETTVVDVVIEPGQEPLYLILSSFTRNIWRFSGETDRVSRVVLVADDGRVRQEPDDLAYASSAARTAEMAARRAREAARDVSRDRPPSPPRARAVAQGVIGLPADRVTTTDGGACFPAFYKPDSIQAARTAAVVRRAIGRDPNVVAGHYALAAVRMPSALGARGESDASPPRGFDPGLWSEGLRFYPAGLTRIDGAQVVSTVDVEPFEVLPSRFGLAQLTGSGALQPIADGLKIVRPIPRFPAGLNGAQLHRLPSGSRRADAGRPSGPPLRHRRTHRRPDRPERALPLRRPSRRGIAVRPAARRGRRGRSGWRASPPPPPGPRP